MATVIEVRVPDIGDFVNVAVIELLVKPGDAVLVNQSLITVESDKASIEIPSPHAGVVRDLLIAIGDKVSQGSRVLTLHAAKARGLAGTDKEEARPPSVTGRSVVVGKAESPAIKLEAAPLSGLPHASPSVRRLGRELGVPLAAVVGSGPRGRITRQDVHASVKAAMTGMTRPAASGPSSAPPGGGPLMGLLPWPQVEFSRFGDVERQSMSRIRTISAANLHRNWVLIPHVTNHEDADVTELEAFRVQVNKENEQSGIKLTMLAFLIKAVVAALKKFPEFNASIDGDSIVLKKYFHIGFAADTPGGLVVPIVKNADSKGLLQISRECAELAAKARDGKLSPAEMSGGCFSVSSLGGIGGRYFTPIINAPEVAILGACKSGLEPRWDGRHFAPRLILPLSLSWDHRVIDGVAAARFNAYLGSVLADFRRLVL